MNWDKRDIEFIKLHSHYKYQLANTYSIQTEIKPETDIVLEGRCLCGNDKIFIVLNTLGILTIYAGYCWDGPSGPTIDTRSFMRGSLVHDVLYQLMREKKIAYSNRKYADKLLVRICRQDGMNYFRALYVYRAVRRLAFKAAKP
jgi:hypothetical protein